MASTPDIPELPPTPTGGPQADPHPELPAGSPTGDPTGGSDLPATTPEGRPAASAAAPASGTVGMYELRDELARGGMGVVYRARHLILDRLVALKMMRADLGAGQPDGQRFDREMRAAARLSHPHILTIHEIGWHQGQPYYTMPYVAGGSLAGQRKRLLADPRMVLVLIEKVARAVHHAHEQGIIHRDLKPANVLLDERGEPLVSDFGLAKIEDDDVELTRTGTAVGTPAYMAPEQAAGRIRQIGRGTDIWALGVMLYELLTGQRPFTGESSEEVKQQIRAAAPPRPRALRPELNAALEAIILKCLRKEPQRRYDTAGALADDLERYLAGERPLALAPPWSSRLAQKVRRHPKRSAAVLAGAAGVLAALILLLLPDRPVQRVLDPPVVLVEGGKPLAEFRWLIGEKAALRKGGTPQEPLSLHSKEVSLLELRSAPPWPRYRLEARIRHDGETGFDGVGIFFGFARHPAARQPYSSYWQLGFAERGQFAGRAQMAAASLRASPPHAPAQSPSFFDDRFSHAFTPALPADALSTWRTLAVEVDGEEVRAFWGPACIQKAPRAWMDEHSARVVARLGDPEARFTPEGGLGIYIHAADASVQDAVLHPLP